MNPAPFRRAPAFLIGAALSSCMASKPPPPPALPPAGSEPARLVASTPVIDIHGHSFNSRLLPIEGIALGKRDIHPLASLASDDLVIALTMWITAVTRHMDSGASFGPECYDPTKSLVRDCIVETHKVTGRQRVSATRLAKHPLLTGMSKVLESGNADPDLGFQERWFIRRLESMFHHHPEIAPQWMQSASGILPPHLSRFVETLTSRETAQVARFHREFDHQVQLVASMMMDLAPTYGQIEDDDRLFGIETEQVGKMERQQANAPGNMIYFAAFNPFRDHWGPDPRQGRSLDIVRDACENHGAWGVKVYPPSGYAPHGTEIPGRPWTLNAHPRRQWDARYTDRGCKLTAAAIDLRTRALFRWAVAADIPLFAHSGTDEVEARKGYGRRFANPEHWRKLLDSGGDMHQLRLCLAHAGGSDYWFGHGGKDAPWGRNVFELCTRYDNVYCEFGAFDAIADPEERMKFAAQLVRLIRESRTTPGCLDFSKKIMYGSDWFMPAKGMQRSVHYLGYFQEAMLQVAADLGDDQIYRDFFHENALAYLRAANPPAHLKLPAATRRRIDSLVKAGSGAPEARLRRTPGLPR
jgi:predicted TIM-barrel fold metal-dependent hydrolase